LANLPGRDLGWTGGTLAVPHPPPGPPSGLVRVSRLRV